MPMPALNVDACTEQRAVEPMPALNIEVGKKNMRFQLGSNVVSLERGSDRTVLVSSRKQCVRACMFLESK